MSLNTLRPFLLNINVDSLQMFVKILPTINPEVIQVVTVF